MRRTRWQWASGIALVSSVTFGAAGTAAQEALTENTLRSEPDHHVILDLADADWLVGTWRGEGFGGTVEEIWGAPAHGQMIGMFRHYTEAEPGFFEILTLGEVEGQTLLRVKHYNGADHSPWEEKDDWVGFRFIKAEPDVLYFSGLTLRKTEDGGLDIFIAMRQGGGEVREAVLQYRGVG